jgi:hypothetical protein
VWRPSTLWLFGDKAGDVGSDAIAVAFLQQPNRVNRSAEKAAPHHRKDNLAERGADDVLVKSVEPRLV